MSEDAWGDLFAMAAGVGSSVEEATSTTTTSSAIQRDGSASSKKNRKRKRTVEHEKTANEESVSSGDSDWQAFLNSRMVPPSSSASAWPLWLILKGSLQGKEKCKGWKSKTSGGSEYAGTCKRCRQSPLHHKVQIIPECSNPKSWAIQAFASLRNLRCTASLLIPSAEALDRFRALLRRESDSLSALKPQLLRQLPQQEGTIVEGKLNDILRQATLLLNIPPKRDLVVESKRNTVHLFVISIRLIVACDALFYRMYYLQLLNLLPVVYLNTKRCFLPHPSDYFGADGLVLDPKTISMDFGADSDPEPPNSDDKWHPLAAIHKLRHMETHVLFSKSDWVSSPRTEKAFSSSLKTFLDKDSRHETPAPDVLMEWRDSCRDFLCNLYAYATLSPSLISKVTTYLTDHQLRLVEVGAGTGYVATLFRDRNLTVDCWDIHPPNPDAKTMNDYHGSTPPFCTVQQASKLPKLNCHGVALLLCYPPPASSMAYDTLRAFLKAGGDYLVHIGEFKGLTGDTRFESLLLDQTTCHLRGECLSWGTDASHVTVWVRKNVGTSTLASKSLLLPCSQCESSESKKRLRLLRSLVYCSKECFEAHSSNRQEILGRFGISFREKNLDYTNSRQFLKLT